ncbi:MAG: DUF3866 family protein [Halanaerobiales bacterium]
MKKILTENNNIQIVEIIRENGNNENAINYISFLPRLKINDKIIINTTAVDLNLGTGGYHFAVKNFMSFRKTR